MSQPDPSEIHKIALLNFGGIGDEILFSPVIQEVRKHLPKAHLTLILEDRSAAVKELLPPLDATVELDVQGLSRFRLFFKLAMLLRGKYFDAVIASGSSPFIPMMLFLSGIRTRIGFETGRTSRMFLTREAPLDLQGYAGDMYFSLAKTFLSYLLGDGYQPPGQGLPILQFPSEEDRQWAKEMMPDTGRRKLLIHPGVSRVSVQKGIVKSWSPEHWAELVRSLSGDHDVYLAGGPDDEEAIRAIEASLSPRPERFVNLYGETRKLRHLAALIERSDLMVSVDSAPMHVAIGLNRPVVALFGPTSPKRLMPPNQRFAPVRAPEPKPGERYLAVAVDAVRRAVDGVLAAIA